MYEFGCNLNKTQTLSASHIFNSAQLSNEIKILEANRLVITLVLLGAYD